MLHGYAGHTLCGGLPGLCPALGKNCLQNHADAGLKPLVIVICHSALWHGCCRLSMTSREFQSEAPTLSPGDTGGRAGAPSRSGACFCKRMQLLKEVVPGLVRVAVLSEFVQPDPCHLLRETEPAARELGFELQPVEARAPKDFEVAFDLARRSKAGALIALDDALTYNHRTRVVALAADSRLPALYGYREFTEEGRLMSYGADLASHYRHAADKICGEQSPARFPSRSRKSSWPRTAPVTAGPRR